jgi:LysR family transcriptional regulator, glycine cleavage system transcriptional activator
VDMASFMGKEVPAGLEGLRLFDDVFQPVCSPAFLRDTCPLAAPADLSKATLLHSVRRMDDWRRWLDLAGMTGLEPKRSLSFENSSLAIQGAIDGLGVAIVQRTYVAELIKVGVLVTPFDLVGRSENGYYLVWSATRAATPAFRSFLQWIRQEVRDSTT